MPSTPLNAFQRGNSTAINSVQHSGFNTTPTSFWFEATRPFAGRDQRTLPAPCSCVRRLGGGTLVTNRRDHCALPSAVRRRGVSFPMRSSSRWLAVRQTEANLESCARREPPAFEVSAAVNIGFEPMVAREGFGALERLCRRTTLIWLTSFTLVTPVSGVNNFILPAVPSADCLHATPKEEAKAIKSVWL